MRFLVSIPAPEEPVFDHNMTGPDAPLPPAARGGRGRMNRGPRLQHMQLCLDGDDDVKITCHAEDQSEMEANLVAYVLLLVAGACLGLGNSGLITIGIAFIDENVKKENSAMYIGTNHNATARPLLINSLRLSGAYMRR